jgi:hypothetical protein
VWVDDDNKDGQSASRVWPIKPTFIVQTSPGKFQVYWCVTGKWLADEKGRAEFEGVIERLVAEHHSDKGAKGINRMLRVPGSLHLKDPSKPFIVRLVKRDGPRYTREQILAAFPPLLQSTETSKTNSVGGTPSEWKDLINNVISGENYHDTLTVLAAKMLRSGMNAGAAVQFLRALMDSSEAPRDDRWRARYLEIPRAVSTAEKKGFAPAPEGITIDDFRSYMLMAGNHIYTPTGELWPSSSVNARVPPQLETDASSKPVLDKDGKEKWIPAGAWLQKYRPVEQITWAPGLPQIINDRHISEGGWIEKKGVACFNLYRPPTIKLGDPNKAAPWLEHVHKVYPNEADHIIKWLAHRVQHPNIKPNHALVLGGKQGIGKDTILEPVKQAVGPWNFGEASPIQVLGRFNGFLRSVILRVSEVRDMGEVSRYALYEHMKVMTAAPPDVLRVDEKHMREHSVLNLVGVLITTNNKTTGIYLPEDDRRHFVAWSDLEKRDFDDSYWATLWGWYASGGIGHVAAYLRGVDLSSFDAKAPPPKTEAWWAIVDANRAPEDSELADLLDALGDPDAVTVDMLTGAAGDVGSSSIRMWLLDRKNRRLIPHRFESCGYVPVRNPTAQSGLWVIGGKRQVVYAKASLSVRERVAGAGALHR